MEIIEKNHGEIVEVIEQAHNLLDEQVVILGEALDKMNNVCVALEKALVMLAYMPKQGREGPS